MRCSSPIASIVFSFGEFMNQINSTLKHNMQKLVGYLYFS